MHMKCTKYMNKLNLRRIIINRDALWQQRIMDLWLHFAMYSLTFGPVHSFLHKTSPLFILKFNITPYLITVRSLKSHLKFHIFHSEHLQLLLGRVFRLDSIQGSSHSFGLLELVFFSNAFSSEARSFALVSSLPDKILIANAIEWYSTDAL